MSVFEELELLDVKRFLIGFRFLRGEVRPFIWQTEIGGPRVPTVRVQRRAKRIDS